MTDALFRQDAYLREAEAKVVTVAPGGIVLDRTVFYPRGGGQAGDAGALVLRDGASIAIGDTVKGTRHDIVHVPAPGQEAALAALRAGDEVEARGALDGATLTATRVLADGPAPVGTVTTTTSGAPTGSTATTTAPTGATATP